LGSGRSEKTVDRNEDEIRQRVAECYGRAAAGESGCCDSPSQADDGVAGLPPEATVNSYGCGSPVAFSKLQPGDVVVDLGCGAGLDLLLAARRVGPTGRVIGVDMTDAMLERARTNIAVVGLDNIDLRQGIIENLPIASRSADWVISNCVINLSPNKAQVVEEIARVLKPGGYTRIADVVAEDVPDWIRQSDDLYDSCVAGAISEADYVAGLRNAGLTDVFVRDRYVYDRQQLGSIASGPLASGTQGDRAAEALVGRVWSVYISATKPLQRAKGMALDNDTNEEVAT
jgi:SAM-dependent methyltransferase